MSKSLIISLLVIFALSFNNKQPNEIYWSNTDKITWEDFQGRKRYRTSYVAQTVSLIEQSYTCRDTAFVFSIKAKFNKDKSWTITNKESVLNHERKHFDITEVYARKMRKAYSELANPCSFSLDHLSKIYDRFFDELKAAQNQYDVETNHGLIKVKQAEWDKLIEQQLQELEAWSD